MIILENHMNLNYRKKPVVIQAWQLTTDNVRKGIPLFIDKNIVHIFVEFHGTPNERHYAVIETLEGNMQASEGDWIIRGVNGEFYPCKPDIFEKTYEVAE